MVVLGPRSRTVSPLSSFTANRSSPSLEAAYWMVPSRPSLSLTRRPMSCVGSISATGGLAVGAFPGFWHMRHGRTLVVARQGGGATVGVGG